MRTELDSQLNELAQRLYEMGERGQEAISRCVDALVSADVTLARAVMADDDTVDHEERDIEDLCMRLLLRQQPVASDLRYVSAALKMITDMERIADQAADICEVVTMLAGRTLLSLHELFTRMGETVKRMQRDALEAFSKRDLEQARRVIRMDDEVDALFNRAKSELIACFTQKDDAEIALDMLMIAKYFERMGDHAVNIAEWVEYAITGRHKGQKIG
jgi:phosphate transport system protein